MNQVIAVFAVLLLVACGGTTTSDSTSSCAAANCAGCCLNNACQPGNTAAACGKNAAACSVCGNNQICKTEQTCGVDPESVWKVQPTSATISTTNQGAAWDVGGGAPDPFCHVWCPSTSSTSTTTPTASDTFSPVWASGGCTAKAKDLIASGFALDVWDEDISSNDPISGKGTIPVTELTLLSGSVGGIGNKATLTNLTVTLTKQ